MEHTTSLQEVLGLSAPPIAIGFSDRPPAGLEKWQGASLSLGCIGNRTFTGLADEEMYICIHSSHWSKMLSSLTEIGKANSEMQRHYRNHRAQFATA